MIPTMFICCACEHFYGHEGESARWACAYMKEPKPAGKCPCACHAGPQYVRTIWGNLPIGHLPESLERSQGNCV